MSVNNDQHIFWPVENTSKHPKTVKVGTYLADYCKVIAPEEGPTKVVQAIKHLHNDLIAPVVEIPDEAGGDRISKLKRLLDGLPWNHLTEPQKQRLVETITHHNQLFILNK